MLGGLFIQICSRLISSLGALMEVAHRLKRERLAWAKLQLLVHNNFSQLEQVPDSKQPLFADSAELPTQSLRPELLLIAAKRQA